MTSFQKHQTAELEEIATLIRNTNETAARHGLRPLTKAEERTLTSDYWKRKAEDESQRLYDVAADIAYDMIEDLPERVRAAGSDPMSAAYALWDHFTRILLGGPYSACDLADLAHEIQEDEAKEKEAETASETEVTGTIQ